MSLTRTQAEAVAKAIVDLIRAAAPEYHGDVETDPFDPDVAPAVEKLVAALVGVRLPLTSRQVIGDPNT